MRGDRTHRIGDMLIVTPDPHRYQREDPGKEYFGVIYDIGYCSWGHQKNVLVEWTNQELPQNYNSKHGYSGTNIHNLRHEFRIIRDGKEVIG